MPVRDPRIWILLGTLLVVAVAAGVTLLGTTDRFGQATATLSVISGQIDVVTGDATPRSGTHGEELAAETTVRPQGPDGRAVLTFRDGSTVELEPEASVKIDEHSLGTRGELLVRLHQDRGKTWSHVQPQLSPNSRFHIRTPSGTAVVRGTSLEVEITSVNGTPVTKVTVFEGRVDLVAGGAVVSVPASHSSEVATGGAPIPAQRVSRSDLCMRIEVTTEALVTVTDPAHRTSGQTALGTVSQIPKTIVTGPQTEPQVVEIFSPTAGEWEIGIVPRGQGGEFRVLVATVLGTQVVSDQNLDSTILRGQRVVTRIRLGDDGRVGKFDAPAETSETRAKVALPSEGTTTVPLPLVRVVAPTAAPLALTCGSPESTDGVGGVPLRSAGPSSGR